MSWELVTIGADMYVRRTAVLHGCADIHSMNAPSNQSIEPGVEQTTASVRGTSW